MKFRINYFFERDGKTFVCLARNGKTYDRLLVAPGKAAALLNWGDVGYSQVMKAKEVIYRRYGITEASNTEEWV